MQVKSLLPMILGRRLGFKVFHGIFGSYKHFKQHRNIYDVAKIRPALGKILSLQC